MKTFIMPSLAVAALLCTGSAALLDLSAPSWIIVSPAAATAAKLGDLSPFQSIVDDTAFMVAKGDLTGAKTRIKNLETSWDEAEPSLKPRAAAEWHTVDKAIDHALDALRASTPDPAACKQALAELLVVMDRASGKQ